VLFAVSIAIVVIAALDPKRPRAWIAGAVVLAPTTFVHQVAAQTADLPLAFFAVVTLVQLRDYLQAARTSTPATRALVVAGLFAGLGAWTKNEGLVLVAGTSLVLAWAVIRLRRIADVAWWGAGLSVPLLAVLWYKLVVAPVAPEYMPATETAGSITQRLLDPGRIQSIVSVAFDFFVRWGGPFAAGVLPIALVAAVAAAVPQRGGAFRYVLAVLAIMVTSYAALWLSAPFDASWLVITTFDRLMVQLWPTLVVAAFSLTAPARA
jgi:4-amino-4-deoxy-L-arabinose transferase-like glycosyltransferase